jgi:hypothetical protein
MTYIPDYPTSQNSPNGSYSQIQTNFNVYPGIFSSNSGGIVYNHFPLNNSKQGAHAAVLFDSQGSIDPPVTNNLVALYAKNYTAQSGTQPQLFCRIKQFLGSGATLIPNNPMQLTLNTVVTGSYPYQTFMLGGLIVYIGTFVLGATQPVLVTLSPKPNSILNIQASIQSGSSLSNPRLSVFPLSNNYQFNLFAFGVTTIGVINWTVIGKA